MLQATGIVINNTHLLRAAMLFMVLGLMGPGLFQLKPPQWFGDSVGTDHLEMATPVTALSDKELEFEPVIFPPADTATD